MGKSRIFHPETTKEVVFIIFLLWAALLTIWEESLFFSAKLQEMMPPSNYTDGEVVKTLLGDRGGIEVMERRKQ